MSSSHASWLAESTGSALVISWVRVILDPEDPNDANSAP